MVELYSDGPISRISDANYRTGDGPMVKGLMKWTNSTNAFGFVEPDDGGRDVFVCLSPVDWVSATQRERDMSISPDGEVVAIAVPLHGPGAHALESSVEVRTRYQLGHWAPGYEIAQVHESGYQVRRPGSLDTLPEIFAPADVRRAGSGR